MPRDHSRTSTRPATIKDVARAAGVSFSTVSRVINNSKPVDGSTRDRVLRAIEQLHYVPNNLARGLQTRQSRSLGVMLPEIGSSTAAQGLKGMEEAARQAGFTILLMTTAADSERELECLSIMRQRQMDGVLWAAVEFKPGHRRWFQRHPMTTLVIAQDFSEFGFPSVLVDNRRAAYEATCHLIQQRHRRIAMIAGFPYDLAVGRDRLRGFEDALRDGGIDPDPCLVTTNDVASQHSGYEAMARLIAQRPTAVLAASDNLAIGAMQLILEQGLSIPEDISIIGFDDLDIAAHPALRLSTVAFDFTELGAVSARTLIRALGGVEEIPPVQILPHRLIIRDTVCPPKA